MKLIHTSDWHLGHTLYNYERNSEHSAMIDQLVALVEQEQPDVFLIAGDVYHTGQPSATVQTLFSNAMVRMHSACPSMHIIVTAGNHDSGSKLDIFRSPWLSLNVHTFGSLDHDDITQHIVLLPGVCYVIAVPYTYERNIPDGFFQQLLDHVASINTDNLPVVLTAHTTVSGCDFTGHDHATELTVGGIDAFELNQMGHGYDYLALGHIHCPQYIHSSRHNVRYSGSPLPVSFDETYPHSVSLVSIDAHGQSPVLTAVDILNPFPLVTLPTQGTATWEQALQLLADYPDDIPAYIRLNVQVSDFLPPDAQQDARQICSHKRCRFCYIKVSRPTIVADDTSVALTLEQFQEELPIDIARRYAQDTGVEFTDELAAMFNEALAQLNT